MGSQGGFSELEPVPPETGNWTEENGAANCLAYYQQYEQEDYCKSTWHLHFCWPPTPANTTARMRCGPNLWLAKQLQGSMEPSNYALRKCSEDGIWMGGNKNDKNAFGNDTNQDIGYTNLWPCVREMAGLNVLAECPEVIHNTRVLEMVGYSLSFVSIVASLIILSAFRSLRTKEKAIHRQLYLAILIQVVFRLVSYTDQYIVGLSTNTSSSNETQQSVTGIGKTPYLCEGVLVLIEYSRTAMFHWFFIEGLHLHNVLTIDVFPSTGGRRLYYVIGWGMPVLWTTAWAVKLGIDKSTNPESKCWYAYSSENSYYIVEGPRLALIAINLIFLLNIIRVLLTKLRNSNSANAVKVRKALKAAIVLQPLLGITNVIQMVAPPGKDCFGFGVWSILSNFLSTFQGFFAALFYCFLNGEVRLVLGKWLERRRTQQAINRQASSFSHDFNNSVSFGAGGGAGGRRGSLPAFMHNTGSIIRNGVGGRGRSGSDARHFPGMSERLAQRRNTAAVGLLGAGGSSSTGLFSNVSNGSVISNGMVSDGQGNNTGGHSRTNGNSLDRKKVVSILEEDEDASSTPEKKSSPADAVVSVVAVSSDPVKGGERPSSLVLRDNPAAIIEEEEEEEEGDESTDRDPLMGGGTRHENGHPPVIISSVTCSSDIPHHHHKQLSRKSVSFEDDEAQNEDEEERKMLSGLTVTGSGISPQPSPRLPVSSNRLSLTGSTGSAGARLASVEELDVADDCDADEGIDEGGGGDDSTSRRDSFPLKNLSNSTPSSHSPSFSISTPSSTSPETGDAHTASTTTHGEGRVGDKSDEGQFQKLQTTADNKGSPTISQFIIETSS